MQRADCLNGVDPAKGTRGSGDGNGTDPAREVWGFGDGNGAIPLKARGAGDGEGSGLRLTQQGLRIGRGGCGLFERRLSYGAAYVGFCIMPRFVR